MISYYYWNEVGHTLMVDDSKHIFLILGINWCLIDWVSKRFANDGNVDKHNSCISVVSASNDRQTIGNMCSFMSVGGVFDKIKFILRKTINKI